MLGITLWRVVSSKGQDRTLSGEAPVERAIDGPLADGAALVEIKETGPTFCVLRPRCPAALFHLVIRIRCENP